jgi:hypothetical protein
MSILKAAIWGFLFLTAIRAQTTGVITGTITDSTGAVVPGAKVTVRNMGTAEERAVLSNTGGFYVVYSLPVGVYEVEASATGFKKTSRSNIQLNVADRLAINLTLEVGAISESVSVTGEAPVVDTEKGDVAYAVETQQMTDLSVNGRTFTQLMQLLPGVSRTMGDEGGLSFNSSRGFAVNGQRPKYSGVSLDGVENTDMGSNNGMFTSPGLETIAELKVQTSNYSAEYGTGGGANLIVATRSGTRDFHGAAYEFLRNDDMDARNFFATTKPVLRYNNFGYRIGGPVYIPGVYNKDKDKTFFFFAQEWRRKRTQSIIRAATPTEPVRAGDFAAEAARIGMPILDPDIKMPFPGNSIPASRLNQNAQLLLKNLFPAPNASGFLNYQTNGPTPENWREETLNVTHQLTHSTQVMVRYIQDTWVAQYPTTLWGSQAFPTISSIANIPGRSFVAKATSVISPTLLNEVSFAYGSNYPAKDQRGVTLTGNYLEPTGLNIPRLFPRIEGRPKKVPNLSFSGGWGNIDSSYYPWWAHHNITTVTDSLSKTVGSHSFKFGGTYQFSKTPVESQVNPADQGGFSFNGSFTNDPMADFVLGRAASYSELDKLLAPSYDYPQLELYAQDTWKVNRRLTLNLGVRWFDIPHIHEASDLISNFRMDKYDPSKAVTVLPDGTIMPNSGSLYNGVLTVKDGLPRGLVHNYYNTFAPRLGFAWDPTGAARWSIRGGYGIGYYRVEGNDIYNMVSNPPGAKLVQVFNPPLDNPAAGQAGALRPVSLNSLDPNYKVPYIQTYSLEVQREITPANSVSLGYVGTRGNHLDRAQNVNQPLPTGGYDFDPRLNTRAIPTELIRPFLGYTNIIMRQNTAASTYHSLQATFKRRMSRGLLFETAYTWSKAIGDASNFGEQPQNAYNLRAERALTAFDRTHVLVFNYIYEVPIFRDRTRLSGKLLGGWQLSGVTMYQSGVPLNLGLTGGTIGLAGRPDVKPGTSLSLPKTVPQWFDTSIFAAPPYGHFGNAGRDLIRGPGIHEWDMALFKTFHPAEKVGFTLRGESFNLFNHTNFDGVSTTFGAGNFNAVTSARIPRLLEVSAKVEF